MFETGKRGAIVSDDGRVVGREQAEEMVRQTVERCGCFIMGADTKPAIGDIQEFAGLPLRAVRFVTEHEALENHCPDIWGEWVGAVHYFEVEVAD